MYTVPFFRFQIFLICMMSSLHCSQQQVMLKKADFSKYELYFLGVAKKVTIPQDKLATRRTFFTHIINKKEDQQQEALLTAAVVELRCKDGRLMQSFPEHGWLDVFHKNGSVEKIYVDNKKFGGVTRQLIEPDGFRKIFFRNGTYATKIAHDPRWMHSDNLRTGLDNPRLNFKLVARSAW